MATDWDLLKRVRAATKKGQSITADEVEALCRQAEDSDKVIAQLMSEGQMLADRNREQAEALGAAAKQREEMAERLKVAEAELAMAQDTGAQDTGDVAG